MEPEIGLIDLEGTDTNMEGVVDIATEPKVVIPERIAQERAVKAHLSMGDLSPGVDSIRSSIQRGDEQFAREDSAASLQLKERDNRLRMLQQVAGSRTPGSPVSQDELDLVAGLSIEPTIDPRTVWEKQYGTFITNELVMVNDKPDGAVNQAITENPQQTFKDLDLARDYIAKNEVTKRKFEEIQARWKDAGFLETLGTFVEQIVPFKSAANIANKPALTMTELPGTTMGEQVAALWAIPSPEAFAQRLEETVNRIADNNLIDAIDFLQAVTQFSASDSALKNIFGVLDIADVSMLGSALVRGARGALRGSATAVAPKVTRPTSEARKAIQDAVKATIGVQHPEKIASALGDTSRAALMKATQKVQSEATEVVSDTAMDRIRGLMNTMPTMTRSMQIFDGSASLSNEAAARISIALENNAQKYVDAVASTITPERLTPQALNQAVENAKADLTRQFTHLNDTVIDLVRNPRDPFTNTDSVSIRLGKPDASTFWSRNNAELYAKDIYQLPEGSYTIGQQGTSFFIDVAKNVDETADSVRNLLVTTDNKTSIPNLAQFLFQGIRTPAETLSALQKANRDAALFGNTNFTQIISEGTKVIGSLGKAEKRDLNRIMEINRDFWDPVTNTRGQYYETASALEQSYVKNIGRLPTEREVEAYYTAVQVNELDLMVRNAVAYRDKARAGIENFQFKATYEGYSEYEPAKFRPSPKFEGKQVDYVPWNSDHLSVLVVDPAAPAPKLIARNAPGEDKALVDQLVKEQGYTIIQVANPAGRPLKSLTNSAEPVQYVVTKDFTRSSLDYQQVGRSPGFHVEYAHSYYVKQPRVYTSAGGVRNYEGDITAFSFSTEAQSAKFTKRMETARQMLKAGDETGLERYLAKNLPYSKESFKELFAPKDGYFDIEQPFVTVAKGKKTIDNIENSLRGNGPFRDLSKSEYNLLDDVDRKFQGERSAMFRTIDELGTEENPVFKFRDAPMIDPLSTTSRALGQAARSRYFGDMKTSAAEQFVKEFADVLDIPADELTKYPSYYLYNPVWKSGANQQELAAAKATQKAALELMGTKTPFGEQLDWMRAKVLNGVYRFGGQNSADLVDNNKLLQSRDPLSFFRGMAFHTKLGLFNPIQVAVQSQGLFHVLAIAPREAGPAMAGYAWMRYALTSGKEEMTKWAASKSRFFGWKPEQFEESLSLMQRTGFLNVGRESTFIDDMSDPKLFQSTFGKFLDKGAVFFKETERMVRMTAWNAAYLQFKKNNPTGVIGNRELGEILARADTLTVNMTNASKASWERGIFSIPAQFQSYNVRMFEQLTGTQLTAQEKMRAFGLYTALYGVPVAASAATLYPWYEDIRGAAIELGYNVDNRFMDAMVEGIPAAMLSAVFGKDFNIAQRYGPGGFSVLKDALNGDKDFLELFLGPAGSVTKDILNTVVPAAGAIGKMMTGVDYTPEVNDLIDAARTISSVNSAHRVYAAMTVGKYISRKGMHLTDSTTPEAITAAITGLQPREFTDAMIMNRSMKDIKEYQNEVGKEFQKYLNRALIEAQQGNYEAADAYMKKANAYKELGDYQPNQLNDLMKQSFNSQNISLMERIKRDWIMRSPASKQQERIQRSIKQNPAPNIEGTNQ